jgi:MFS family permease
MSHGLQAAKQWLPWLDFLAMSLLFLFSSRTHQIFLPTDHTPHFVSFTASLGVISNPIGALLAGILMEMFGRKTTVKLTSLPYIIGWVLISLSDNIVKLYAGRFISGVAVGT